MNTQCFLLALEALPFGVCVPRFLLLPTYGCIALKPTDPVECLSQTFAAYILASEDFFDKLTVEQEFMSGIDTDKVCGAVLQQSWHPLP